ncbi:MAG: hypothetical protein V1880_01625 [Patescibacteria group bacterium]
MKSNNYSFFGPNRLVFMAGGPEQQVQAVEQVKKADVATKEGLNNFMKSAQKVIDGMKDTDPRKDQLNKDLLHTIMANTGSKGVESGAKERALALRNALLPAEEKVAAQQKITAATTETRQAELAARQAEPTKELDPFASNVPGPTSPKPTADAPPHSYRGHGALPR